MTKHRVKGRIYIRGSTYWYRYRSKRGSLGIPAGIDGSKQVAQDAFGRKVKAIVDGRSDVEMIPASGSKRFM